MALRPRGGLPSGASAPAGRDPPFTPLTLQVHFLASNAYTPGNRPPDRAFVASLAKGLAVLAAFEDCDELGNHELVAITGMPKATVSRFTGTLEKLGYLRLDEKTRKYRIGGRVLNLGAITMQKHGIQQTATAFMEALADELDVSVLLATREHARMLVLEIVRPPLSPVTINKQVGDTLAMETTSLGLAYLVAAPTNERTRILRQLQQSLSPEGWASYRADVERVHGEFKSLGFVMSGRVRGGVLGAVAAPIVTAAGEVFVISCAAPSQRMTKTRLEKSIGPRLVDAARAIQARMVLQKADLRRAGPAVAGEDRKSA